MPCDINMLCGISSRFQLLSPSERQVAHALLTRPPLSYVVRSEELRDITPFDLHVLGTPPAFVLSQDQTLVFNPSLISCSSQSSRFNSFLTLLLLFLYRFQDPLAPLELPSFGGPLSTALEYSTTHQPFMSTKNSFFFFCFWFLTISGAITHP